MENLQVINHPQFGQLSVVIVDGKEMFKAKDVAIMLGYEDTINAVKQHCKGGGETPPPHERRKTNR